MALPTIHGTEAAVATAILSRDLSIDVVDKNDCHDGEDNIYDDSCIPTLIDYQAPDLIYQHGGEPGEEGGVENGESCPFSFA